MQDERSASVHALWEPSACTYGVRNLVPHVVVAVLLLLLWLTYFQGSTPPDASRKCFSLLRQGAGRPCHVSGLHVVECEEEQVWLTQGCGIRPLPLISAPVHYAPLEPLMQHYICYS